jgi:glycosidase
VRRSVWQVVPSRFARAAALALALCPGCSRPPTEIPAPWWRDKVFYEVFVRSFGDSDGDGVGDLPGLAAHLDDLNDGDPATSSDLGVDALWLMPVFPSPSYHGYDVTDYRGVNPQYGTLGDLEAVIQGAHRRGMRVILDMVLNHSSSQHPWFLDSQRGPGSARRDWYLWSSTNPGWQRPWGGEAWYALGGSYYWGLFSPSMPDLNLGNAAVEAELVASMKFWLARGVDGFRLDAVRHFFESAAGDVVDQPETHAFLRRLRSALAWEYPGAILVAEAWTNVETQATYWGAGDEAQLAFSFDLADALKSAAAAGDASAAINLLARAERAFAGKDRAFEAPFLANHDQVRVMRALGGDPAAARVAAAALLAAPGTPFLYYGEEIGMQGGAGTSDVDKRTAMRWTGDAPGFGFTSAAAPWAWSGEAPGTDVAAQRADPASLWNWYRRLLALRRSRPALGGGDALRPPVTGGGVGLLALLRTAPSGRVLFVANFAAAPTGPFSVGVAGAPVALEAEGLAGPPSAAGDAVSFPGLAGRGSAFVSLD